MDFQTIKTRDDQYVMHTYGRFPVDIDHGRNATLWSADEDFTHLTVTEARLERALPALDLYEQEGPP